MQVRPVRQHLHIVGCVAEIPAVLGLFKEDGIHRSHTGREIVPVERLRHRRRLAGPLFLHGLRHLTHLGRRGAGPDGVGENVHLGKAAPADEVQRLGKFLLRLLRKPGDEVRGDSGVVKILI